MRKFDVQIALEGVREAHKKWGAARKEFDSNVDFVMSRLLHEAAVNFMSVDQVAVSSGMTTYQVRDRMRRAGLDPKKNKTLLAKAAAEALAENSALLGIEPHEMDLTSPLAYLPMGSELKQQLLDARVHRVTELPDEYSTEGLECPGCPTGRLDAEGCCTTCTYEVNHEHTEHVDGCRLCPDVSGNVEQEAARLRAMLADLGFCPRDGEPLPCMECGAGL